MQYQYNDGVYLIRLMPEEELVQTLTTFCQEKAIVGGWMAGLGGAKLVELAHFNIYTQQYSQRVFAKEGEAVSIYEIVNLTGNISIEKLHIHMTIGDDQFQTYSGHCVRAVADPTIEITLTPFSKIRRAPDSYSGLELLDLPSEF